MAQLRSLVALSWLGLAPSACGESGDVGGDAATSDMVGSSESGTTMGESDTAGETDTGDSGYPSGQVGTEVGDTIADLVFYRGDGEALALSAYAGQGPPALIIFGTASW